MSSLGCFVLPSLRQDLPVSLRLTDVAEEVKESAWFSHISSPQVTSMCLAFYLSSEALNSGPRAFWAATSPSELCRMNYAEHFILFLFFF